jgi:cysteine desulfuration protein SufE
MNSTAYIPPRLQEIIADFRDSDRQEKLALLLEFADQMPELPEWLHDQHERMDHVHECMTPVYVFAEERDQHLYFLFDVPPESPTIRGYAALLADGLAGSTAEEVLRLPADFFYQMGLQDALSPQRLNGISAILAHIKRLAVQHLK